jgi:hypothetical protein
VRAVCTTGSRVTITAVTAVSPTGGIKVTSWGIRHRHSGDTAPDLAATGVLVQEGGFVHTPVSAKCGDLEHVDEFAISVARPTENLGTMTGVWMHYGTARKAMAQYEVILCRGDSCDEAK